MANTFVYVGCWGEHGGVNGMWKYTYNESTGALTDGQQITTELSSSNTYVDTAHDLLYFVDEIDQKSNSDIGEGGGGRVWIYRVNPSTGDLTELQKANSYGSNPSMCTIDPTGKYAVISNHGAAHCACQTMRTPDGEWHITPAIAEASIVLCPRNDDGTLGAALDISKFEGPVVSHMHSCVWAPNGKFFIANDKGSGFIFSMAIDTANNILVRTSDPFFAGKGSKPRYVRFHPTKNWLYVNFEAANQLDAFSYDDNGNLTLINNDLVVPQEQRDSVPKDYRFEQQDMKMDAQGKFVYTVYRGSGDNPNGKERVHLGGFCGVAVFQIDQSTGGVQCIQRLEFDDINWPRGCAISPDGKFLLVASLYSDKIATLTIGSDGKLTDTKVRSDSTTPSSVTFFQA